MLTNMINKIWIESAHTIYLSAAGWDDAIDWCCLFYSDISWSCWDRVMLKVFIKKIGKEAMRDVQDTTIPPWYSRYNGYRLYALLD